MILARDKQSDVFIVYPQKQKDVRPVAVELRRVLLEMTGARFDIQAVDDAQTSGKYISLSVDSRLKTKANSRRPKPVDCVAWECDGKSALSLTGNSIDALWTSLYAFLETHLDCRWFFPGKLGEDIPQKKLLKIGRIKKIFSPSFITRDFFVWPETFQRKKLAGGPSTTGPFEVLNTYLRDGKHPRCMGIHSYHLVVSEKERKKHPEYRVMINGKREPFGQVCVSQKGVEDLAVAYCLEYFEKYPNEKIVGLNPDDGEIFCDCPECKKTNLGKDGKKGNPWWVTRSIIEFSNRVAERVAKVHPDKLLMTNAYSRTKKPLADMKVHPNVLINYCSQPRNNWQGKGAMKNLETEISAWTACAKHVGIFDYLVNRSWPGLPRTITGLIAHQMKFFHKKGVRYYYSQHADDFGISLPNYYLLAALLWDVKRDPDQVLDDMYRRCFRKAAPAAKEYFRILEDVFMANAGTGPGPLAADITGMRSTHETIYTMYSDEVLALLKTQMDRASRLAKGDSVAVRRLKLVKDGFVFLQTTMEAVRKACDFVTRYRVKSFTPWAWNVGNYDYHNTLEKMELFGEPCIQEFLDIRAAWDQYRETRKRLEKTFAITSIYSHGGPSFDPKEVLDNTWDLYTGKKKTIPLKVTAKSMIRAM